MATEKTYNGDGSDTTFDITFPYLTHADIGVSVGGVTKTVGSDYSITGDTVTFTTAPASGTDNVKLYRNTDIDNPEHEYSAGSSITAARLNENQRQALYAIEEAKLVTTTSGGITTGNKNDITVNSDTDWVIRANAVEKSMMADNSVGTDEIETNAVTATEIAANAVTMDKLSSGALPTDITIDRDNIVADAIRTGKIKDAEITLAKLATAVANSLNPVGTVIWYAGSNAPAGYLKANGDSIANGSGTTQSITADFSDLYAIVGNTLPDLRGEFIRGATGARNGIDETNVTAHTGTGGPTFSNTGVLRTQGSKNKEHTHTTNTTTTTNGNSTKLLEGEFQGEAHTFAPTGIFSNNGTSNRDFDDGTGHRIKLDATHNHGMTNSGGTESRPRNVALLACIKY